MKARKSELKEVQATSDITGMISFLIFIVLGAFCTWAFGWQGFVAVVLLLAGLQFFGRWIAMEALIAMMSD